jgi:ArsR family transcriptional regulator
MIDIIFKALSEESRLRILSVIMEREMCVCEIEVCLRMTQSNASRHLTVLKNCGILDNFKVGQWAYYKISDTFVKNHKELFEYLKIKLIEIPTYHIDRREYEKCCKQDVCAQCKKPH